MQAKQDAVRGFLISCDKNRQKQALQEAYTFLTTYIEQIYSDLPQQRIRSQIHSDGKELTLENEVAYGKKSCYKWLFQVQTHVNCVIFVKINQKYPEVDVRRVAANIMKDVHQEGKEVSRYCHKLLPVERAFRAEHFRMIDELEDLFFVRNKEITEIKSWMLNYKCRNNNKFSYKEVLAETEKIAKKYNHFVDVYYPQWTVSIQITNHLMCISITQGFKESSQFRLHKKGVKKGYNEENRQRNNEDRQGDGLKRRQRDRTDRERERSRSRQIRNTVNELKEEKQKIQEQQQQQERERDANNLLTEVIQAQEDEDIDLL